jgi:outer membrane protein TolC
VLISQLLGGCLPGEKKIHYIGKEDLQYYKDQATEIIYPTVESDLPDTVAGSLKPRTLRDRLSAEVVWDMPLAEAIHLSLLNNKILRVGNDFATQIGQYTPGSRILSSPDQVASIYDPSIQETGVLFGGRGVEAALAAFDTQFTTNMLWGRNETITNSRFTGGLAPGATQTNETGTFLTQLNKNFATGGNFQLSHEVDYTGTNLPRTSTLFPSSYAGSVRADFRQPLWSGGGVDFTRVAGPIGQNIQGVSGVNQGVLISRINEDITIADFEFNVTGMLFDTERAYWDLYNGYRQYDAAVKNREAALQSWRKVKTLLDLGGKGGGAADEAQARETYFQRRAVEESSLRTIDTLETALRRMCGLPVNDGRIVRPADEPIVAEFIPDWHVCLAEMLTRHVNLRRQKWSIKSLELQLGAARNLAHPRFDFVSSYQVNGFGDKLLSQSEFSPSTGLPYNNYYGTLLSGQQTGWTAGFQFSMPLGLRIAHAQVRNLELRVAKAREVLSAQEEELSYELAKSFQDLALHWTNAQTNFNRRVAAEREVQAFQAEYTAGTKTLDLLLQAQARLADAENAYYSSIVEYNKTLALISYRKGTLLEMNNVHLSEGQWNPEAYRDALRRAWARTYAFEAKFKHTDPDEFAVPGPAGTADFKTAVPPGSTPEAPPPATPTPEAEALPPSDLPPPPVSAPYEPGTPEAPAAPASPATTGLEALPEQTAEGFESESDTQTE